MLSRLLARPRLLHSGALTHATLNQAESLPALNLYTNNKVLSSITSSLSSDLQSHLTHWGGEFGSQEAHSHAALANANPPQLQTHTANGHRLDQVLYSPSYHQLMSLGVSSGVTNLHLSKSPGSHIARGALIYMLNQVDPGVCCPIVMTFAAFHPIANSKGLKTSLRDSMVKKLRSGVYDGRNVPMEEKEGITVGMSMTEKQGGSDVRANSTVARKVEGEEMYEITGHKWFTSAPNSDAFLTLAKVDGKVSCFVVPRFVDGVKNEGLQFQRLKEKLGDKSNASSEVEYRGALGYLIGSVGRGVPDIIEMVHHTRLECTIGSAAAMDRALRHAVHHCRGREAFGQRLVDQPLMRHLLADLMVESKAATMLAMRLARAFDEGEERLARVAVAAGKFHICKRQPQFVYECLEILGGVGYCETFPLAAMFRASPLNSVWEGSGNVMALDVLRAIGRDEGIVGVLEEVWEEVKGRDEGVDEFWRTDVIGGVERLRGMESLEMEMHGRAVASAITMGLQCVELTKAVEAGICSDLELRMFVDKLEGGTGNYGSAIRRVDKDVYGKYGSIIEQY